MTKERWTDEMLDKLANFGQQTDNRIDRLVELFSEMRSNQAMLQQEQTEMRREFNHTIRYHCRPTKRNWGNADRKPLHF